MSFAECLCACIQARFTDNRKDQSNPRNFTPIEMNRMLQASESSYVMSKFVIPNLVEFFYESFFADEEDMHHSVDQYLNATREDFLSTLDTALEGIHPESLPHILEYILVNPDDFEGYFGGPIPDDFEEDFQPEPFVGSPLCSGG